jgi:uncharacterized protein YprB with RNaseH-like and TPR domain
VLLIREIREIRGKIVDVADLSAVQPLTLSLKALACDLMTVMRRLWHILQKPKTDHRFSSTIFFGC